MQLSPDDLELRRTLEALRGVVQRGTEAQTELRDLVTRIEALADAESRLPRWTLDDARAYIAKVTWTFARSMPTIPHWYTVRGWRHDLRLDFLAFAVFIRQTGEVKPWPRDAEIPTYHHTYKEIDGWEYWTMGEPIVITTVINRARIEHTELESQESAPAT